MQWRIVVKDGRIVEVTESVGVEGSRVILSATGRHAITF